MANPTCTISGLNTACFRDPALSNLRRKQLLVWFLASELKGIGGTDYTSKLVDPAADGLLGDTVALLQTSSAADLEVYRLTIAKNAAIAAGGTTDEDIQTLMQNIAPLTNVSDEVLNKMIVLLTCKLGVHKDYVQ